MWTIDKLRTFLIEAKQNTYSSGKKSERLTKGEKIFTFSNGNFTYKDTYYGNIVDAGQEVVWHDHIPIWSMSYRGGMIMKDELSHKCFEFLVKALHEKSNVIPARGPMLFKRGDFKYNNNIKGTINNFFGTESITYFDEVIYMKNYIGGLIHHREIDYELPPDFVRITGII